MKAPNPSRSAQPEDAVEHILRVVNVGLEQDRLSQIKDILRTIAEVCSAFGCILWESSPATPDKIGPFFALAQWFPNNLVWDQHDIPVKSLTGHAISEEHRWDLTNDLREDPRAHPSVFLLDRNLTKMCTAPVEFIDKAVGGLNIFRHEDEDDFVDEDGVRLHQIATFFPALFSKLRDTAAYRLSQAVNLQLQKLRLDMSTPENAEHDLGSAAENLCKLIAMNLYCRDVSIFLKEPDSKKEEFHLYGTNLADRQSIGPTMISGNQSDPTAYPLSTKRPLMLFDLNTMVCDSEYLAGDKKLTSADTAYVLYMTKIVNEAAAALTNRDIGPTTALDERARKVPLSFLCAPILAGDEALGVVRCCAPHEGPTYFAKRETKLLLLIAGQIGQFVSDQRSRWELMREFNARKVLFEGVSSIMDNVDKELQEPHPRETAIITRSLETIRSVISASDFVEFLDFDPGTNIYRHLPNAVKPAFRGGPIIIPVGLEAALKPGKPKLIKRSEIMEEEYSDFRNSLHHPIPDQLILAPVECKIRYGILAIAHQEATDLPGDVTPIAGLLGRLIGLYRHLLAHLTLLQSQSTRTTQAFMDLEHQIRAPLRQAAGRLPRILGRAKELNVNGAAEKLVKEIEYLQGINRRAQRVANNVRLFTNLAAGKPIEVEINNYSLGTVRGWLIAAAMGYQLTSEFNGQPLTFGVVTSAIDSLPRYTHVRVDKRLFEQALDDLLDNASKYSSEGERIRIEVSVTKGSFIVTVINRGLRIDRTELDRLIKRGERGDLAEHTVGEGSGIGLWIVDEITKAHNGRLEIQPTNPEGYTYIRMIFPWK